MTGPVIGALLGHWRRNPLQLFTLIAGLALATALWSGVQAINAEARASYNTAANTVDEAQFDRLRRTDGAPMSEQTYITLRRAGWLVSPLIQGRLGDLRLLGVEPLTAPRDLLTTTSTNIQELAPLLGQTPIAIVHPASAALLPATVTAQIDRNAAIGTAVMDIGAAQSILGRVGQIDQLIMLPTQPINQPDLSGIAPHLTLQTAQSGTDIGSLTDSFHLNLTAFGLLSFAVGIFIVNGAIGLAFEQRRSTIRTLRALGVPLRRLVTLIVVELTVLSLIAGAIGVALGYVIAALLLPDVAATLRGLYGAEVGGQLQLRPIWWASGLAIAVLGTLIAATTSLFRLARLPLLAGAQSRAHTISTGPAARYQAIGSAALLSISFILAFTADGLVAGFALLGALLIGAALALPLVLRVVLGFASLRARGVTMSWFWADSRAQLPGLSLALMALLLAMAANVGVSTMVSSFRLTFLGFLDQRLVSELYVDTQSMAEASAIQSYSDPRITAILPVQSVQAQVMGQPVEIYGQRAHATYRDNWKFLSNIPLPWDQMASGSGAAINEQLARRSGLQPGDVISLASSEFTVVGTFGDYGNPIGQVIIDEARFNTLYPAATPRRFALRVAPDQVADVAGQLTRDLGIPPIQVINQAQIKAFSLAIFDRTFTVTTALNILTLSVAGFAILMSLLTLSAMRVPQLAPAWAMGMTRRQLGLLELLRAVMLAVLTGLLALPLGLGLAWALLAVVNVAAFGWELPMYLFPWKYLQLGGLSLLAAAVAAAWPALRLARTPPADLLKVFSNER